MRRAPIPKYSSSGFTPEKMPIILEELRLLKDSYDGIEIIGYQNAAPVRKLAEELGKKIFAIDCDKRRIRDFDDDERLHYQLNDLDSAVRILKTIHPAGERWITYYNLCGNVDLYSALSDIREAVIGIMPSRGYKSPIRRCMAMKNTHIYNIPTSKVKVVCTINDRKVCKGDRRMENTGDRTDGIKIELTTEKNKCRYCGRAIPDGREFCVWHVI